MGGRAAPESHPGAPTSGPRPLQAPTEDSPRVGLRGAGLQTRPGQGRGSWGLSSSPGKTNDSFTKNKVNTPPVSPDSHAGHVRTPGAPSPAGCTCPGGPPTSWWETPPFRPPSHDPARYCCLPPSQMVKPRLSRLGSRPPHTVDSGHAAERESAGLEASVTNRNLSDARGSVQNGRCPCRADHGQRWAANVFP